LGQGICGAPLLHAALLDERITRIVLQDALTSYRLAVDRPIHHGLYDVAIPGVLRKYDLEDIVLALNPRPVVFINPVDALGRPVSVADFRKQAGAAGESGRVLIRSRDRRGRLLPLLYGTN